MKEIKFVVEKIENELVRLLEYQNEDNEIFVPQKFLPKKTKEGSILKIQIELEKKITENKEKDINNLINKLRNKNN